MKKKGKELLYLKNDVKSFAREWLSTLLKNIDNADAKTKEDIMRKLGRKCGERWYNIQYLSKFGYDLESHDLDSFGKAFKKSCIDLGKDGSVRRENNAVYITIEQRGSCACPLVMDEIIELTPILCKCSTQLMEDYLTHVTGKPVKTELIKSVALGDDKCVWKGEI